MAINVTEEYKKIKDLIKANGKLLPKDRNAIPQMEMPTRDPKKRAREMDEVALGFSAEQAVVEELDIATPAIVARIVLTILVVVKAHAQNVGEIAETTLERFPHSVDLRRKGEQVKSASTLHSL